MMKLFLLCVFIVYGAFALPTSHVKYEALSNEIIDYINSLNTTWKAGKNPRFEGQTIEDVKVLCGMLERGPVSSIKRSTPIKDIPKTFDAREQWPHCLTISDIRDQGACGSCWAFGAVESMSDRYCIKYNEIVNISAEDMLSCCPGCGMGCGGGIISAAWDHWMNRTTPIFHHHIVGGVVTGGQYGTVQGCQPYTITKCNHDQPGPYPDCTVEEPTPDCLTECISDYGKEYDADKHYGLSSYGVSSSVEDIQTEIMTNGPVESGFTVYADFPSYKSGVYQYKHGDALGGHAIKILGWGVESDTPYWLVANSWNVNWGDKGYFKIIQGTDECGIESSVVAGEPAKYSG